MDDIHVRWDLVQARILKACDAVCRDVGELRLVAISKRQSSSKIRALYDLGQRCFGENYVDELEKKAQDLSDLKDIKWVFTGQLQSNKIKRVLSIVHEVQSVASMKQVRYLAKYWEGSKPLDLFISVNAGQEVEKKGCSPDEVADLEKEILKYEQLHLLGIMTIPPKGLSDDRTVPSLYKELRQKASSIGAGKLSLGMSRDLEPAIACGTDVLRIGTDLFGSRT